jgi:glyceraldehyde-3-phosphate dehydrogenase (NAD(P))
MKLVGVVMNSFNWRVNAANKKGYPIYAMNAAGASTITAENIIVRGMIGELLKKVDIIIDCTPSKVGAINKEKYYLPNKTKVIFQGGEKADIGEVSFTAQCNYNEARGKNYVRVVSCNTTGLARTLNEVNKEFGINNVYATLIRRASDTWDIDSGPINGIIPVLELPSHHGPDVNTVLKGFHIFTTALSCSTTLMHVHTVTVDCKKLPTIERALEIFKKATRIRIIEGKTKVTSTPELMEYSKDLERNSRGDMPEICIWKETIGIQGNKLLYIQAIHQESNVICENIDAVRAMLNMMPAEKSIIKTNQSLNIK